jgi:hypothetical protein
MLTIRTAGGEGFTVSRDFPSGYFLEVDAILARIFRENPAIAGITFPAQGERPAHTATAAEPFQSPGTKEIITGSRKPGNERACKRLDPPPRGPPLRRGGRRAEGASDQAGKR